jgi:TRAP-type uncharacterized transport system fused permease subunit
MVLVAMIGVTMAVFGYLIGTLSLVPRGVVIVGALGVMLTADLTANLVGTALILAVISWEFLHETQLLGQVRDLG